MNQDLNMLNRIKGGLTGVIVGDALGVPVEFYSRSRLKQNPVCDMRSGGSWNQEYGTWSDDSSLTLCLVNSLLETGYDPNDVGRRFVRWWRNGYCTAHGECFDIGVTTSAALMRIERGIPALQAGLSHESNNGNGSLMRILPAVLYFNKASRGYMLKTVAELSCITHAHARSQLGCCLYALMARKLLNGFGPQEAYEALCSEARDIFSSSPLYPELKSYGRILGGELASLGESEIFGYGYIVYCLEAVLWCLLNHQDFSGTVLAAVNLGDDTDTNAAVAGGLAGICYGQTAIPQEWQQTLAGWNELAPLFDRFARLVHGWGGKVQDGLPNGRIHQAASAAAGAGHRARDC